MYAMSDSQALNSKPKSWDAGQINFSSLSFILHTGDIGKIAAVLPQRIEWEASREKCILNP